MPFDPTYPPLNADIESAPLRSQFNGLKALIDAVPTITSAVVDGVTSAPSGNPATVGVRLSGGVLHLTFGLPQGEAGPTGPPFAGVVVDGVSTLPAEDMATVSAVFDGTEVRLTFGIPRGFDGTAGVNGLPGEVSLTDLNNGLLNTLSQCSANSNAVATLDTPMADPDAEALRVAFNGLVNALRR